MAPSLEEVRLRFTVEPDAPVEVNLSEQDITEYGVQLDRLKLGVACPSCGSLQTRVVEDRGERGKTIHCPGCDFKYTYGRVYKTTDERVKHHRAIAAAAKGHIPSRAKAEERKLREQVLTAARYGEARTEDGATIAPTIPGIEHVGRGRYVLHLKDGKPIDATLNFGKVRGKKASQLALNADGRGYLNWILGKETFEDELKAVVRFILGK